MSRPDVKAALAPLKPFQRRTVDHAFHRLFLAKDSTARFLVADEVGLGKTLVARGIIARAIDHLWDEVERIDIVYICSNGSIARANLHKLAIEAADERSFALATRLTMLATELAPKDGAAGLVGSKLNFVSFTPGTSFSMGRSGGWARERLVLFRLLEPHVDRRVGLMNLLQGKVQRTKHWRWMVNEDQVPLDPSIRDRFGEAFSKRADLRTKLDELIETWFFRHRDRWPSEARSSRNALIASLRQVLAEVCVHALEPDLVILDEFQRFKSLLETREEHRDPTAELAQTLFGSQTPEGNPVRTLLLSATPYKLYTADAEIEHEDHYADFLATTRFLLGGREERVDQLKVGLSRFGTALKRAAVGDPSEVLAAKHDVERLLRSVMARTERVAATVDRDAMLVERETSSTITPADVRQYMAADALFRAVGDRDPMTLWKSAPYLLHFMRGYRVNERLEDALERSPDRVAKVLREHAPAFLDKAELVHWARIDPGNAKLRALVHEMLDGGLWRLLWIPPTMSYWPLEGPFEGHEHASKTLLFSAWNVVPDVVSAILSYEADRRMVGDRRWSSDEPAKKQVPLLRLTQSSGGRRSRHRLFLLLLPCLPLATRAHPLLAPVGEDRQAFVRARVEELLAELPEPSDGEVDGRWEWAVLLLLDPGLRGLLEQWRDDREPDPNDPDAFGQYVGDLLELDVSGLGRRPAGLAELVTEVALGSPAILAARAMLSATLDDEPRRWLATRVADAFWRLFNRPTVITLLARLTADSPGDDAYWRLVLRYCRQGNLQAVLDEQWHLLWEQHAWSAKSTREEIATKCTKLLAEAIQPPRARVHARFLRVAEAGRVESDELRIRTSFALRFGEIRTDEEHVTQDAVRSAFNSPFRPFVLTSTSVGQEGLDFHPWCLRLVHWNLPGNPVDLEQREGRVHRYKGHAVRRNVAASQGRAGLECWRVHDDPWQWVFDLADHAARSKGESDLVPYWIAEGEHRVQRHVPMLPYTKEIEAFRRLKRQLAAYRVVFGQPRQEELVTLLDQAALDEEQLRAWAVDLKPPSGNG
ncbi:MAG: helicase-related protein [Nannocystaceae bacterium]